MAGKPRAGLTPGQEETLQFIALTIERQGFPPTLKEMARQFGAASSNAANDRVRGLVQKGMVERHPLISRGITITPAGRAALRGLDERKQLG